MAGNAKVDEHDRRPDIDKESRIPNRLILCFDGTGNSFQGTAGDTNIVKLLDLFNRSAPRQMHYYQPGIGTYTADGAVNLGFFGRIKKSLTQTIDSGFATSFETHVIAGYRFLMRYYGKGDRIYIFGFSRGAFTARFLARMISHVGLLSMGNEEMVPFAYKVYQDYEMGIDDEGRYMKTFRSTFCRHEVEHLDNSVDGEITKDVEVDGDDCSDEDDCHSDIDGEDTDTRFVDTGIKVHFLGLFDTVNSVGTFDVPFGKVMKVPNVIGTAEHVRHAVAIDERRVKFKVALLAQDKIVDPSEDIKEVWFPGNHGDIGGGWLPEPEPEKRETWWQRIKRAFSKPKAQTGCHAHVGKKNDRFQLSDIALKWMIDELENLPTNTDRISLDRTKKSSFMKRFAKHRSQAIEGFIHDTMTVGRGSSFGKAMMWKLMEYLPFIRRWEYEHNKKLDKYEWQYKAIPLNKGDTRDIPHGATLHYSVIERMQKFPDTYHPKNKASIGKYEDLDEALSAAIKNETASLKDDPYLEYSSGVETRRETDRIFKIMPPSTAPKHSR